MIHSPLVIHPRCISLTLVGIAAKMLNLHKAYKYTLKNAFLNFLRTINIRFR